MKLTIDTSKQEETTVALLSDNKQVATLTEKKVNTQLVLPLIERIIAEQNIKLSDITEIEVHSGPGSFTGLRVGIAVATTLGKLLKIPVNGQLDADITPKYN